MVKKTKFRGAGCIEIGGGPVALAWGGLDYPYLSMTYDGQNSRYGVA